MNDGAPYNLATDGLVHEAVDWIVRLTSGAATAADAEELAQWREKSRQHDEAFKQAARLWNSVGTAAAMPLIASPPRSFRMSRRAMITGALAASATGVLLLRPPYRLWPSLGETVANLDADFRTEIGKQQQVKLLDGIQLQMNTRTSIALNKDAVQPGFNLIAGEAFITAQAASGAGVVVSAANGHTQIEVGQVNIRRDGEDVFVTCIDGRAAIECSGRGSSITAGQQITYGNWGLGDVRVVDVDAVASWRTGRLVFRDRLLSDVINEVNRYRTRPIILANSSFAARRVSGTFYLEHLDEVVTQIQQAYGAKVTALPGGIVLLT